MSYLIVHMMMRCLRSNVTLGLKMFANVMSNKIVEK